MGNAYYRRWLGIERLENREVPAATAYQSGTSIYINGDEAANTIVIRQTDIGKISVTGSGLNRSFTNVSRVIADGRGGNDYLYVDTAPLGTRQSSAVKTTLYGGSGHDTIVAGANADYIDGGAGNDIIYGNAGDDILIGSDGNDALYGGLGNDQIYGVAGDDVLSGGSGNDQLYGGAGTDILEGGQGNDQFAGGSGFDSYKNNVDPQAVANKQTETGDVQQGEAATCVVLSVLAAMTNAGVDLSSRIRSLGGNQYGVQLYRPGQGWVEQIVYFDGSWTDNDPKPASSNGYWTILYQRAYLQEKGVFWSDKDSANWERRYGDDFQRVDQAMTAILGRADWKGVTKTGFTPKDQTLLSLAGAATRPTIVLTRNGTDGSAVDLAVNGLIPSHAYTLVGAKRVGNNLTLVLFNPWGVDGPRVQGADDGIIEISWAAFNKTMLGYCLG